jgi:hypothetical protein
MANSRRRSIVRARKAGHVDAGEQQYQADGARQQ